MPYKNQCLWYIYLRYLKRIKEQYSNGFMNLESYWHTAPELTLAPHLQHPGIPLCTHVNSHKGHWENVLHVTSPSTITNFSFPAFKEQLKDNCKEQRSYLNLVFIKIQSSSSQFILDFEGYCFYSRPEEGPQSLESVNIIFNPQPPSTYSSELAKDTLFTHKS